MKKIILLIAIIIIGCIATTTTAATNVNNIKLVKLKDVVVSTDASKRISKALAKKFLLVQSGYGSTTSAKITYFNRKLTIYLTDNVQHSGRWFAINAKLLDKFNINLDMSDIKVDNKPAVAIRVHKKDGRWLYFYVDHFTTRTITISPTSGYIEYNNVYNESYGTMKVIDKRPIPGCVLYYNFSPSDIVYNATSGHYEIIDLSGHGNNGTIYGLNDNVLSTTTLVTGSGTVYVDFPYYNNITLANLTVYWNTSGILTPVLVSVSLNGNSLGSFIAAANTTGTYTFTNVQAYILVNTTNTVTYSSNNSIKIEKTEFVYDHNLTLVHTSKGWSLWLDGINDYIAICDKPYLNFKSSMTALLGLRLVKSSSIYQAIMGKYFWGAWQILAESTNTLTVSVFNGTTRYGLGFSKGIPLQGYVIIGMRFNKPILQEILGYKIYISRDDVEGTINNATGYNLIIGAREGRGNYLGAKITAIYLFNTSININQIKLLSNFINSNSIILCDFGNDTQMNIDSAYFNGTDYILKVNITLPADGYEHLIYIPSSAVITYPATYSVVATTTDSRGEPFKIVDVGTANYVTYNITVPFNLSKIEGINLAAFIYNNKLYLAGNVNGFTLVNVTAVNLPKGVWYTSGVTPTLNITPTQTKLQFSTNTTTTLHKIDVDILPQSWINMTILSYNSNPAYKGVLIRFKAHAPTGTSVKFIFAHLNPKSIYKVVVDGNKTITFQTDAQGVGSFTWSDWSTHTFVITYSETLIDNFTSKFVTMAIILMVLGVVLGIVMGVAESSGIELLDLAMSSFKYIVVFVGLIMLLLIVWFFLT